MSRTITARVHRAAKTTGEQLLLTLWTLLVFLFGNMVGLLIALVQKCS